MRKALAGVLSLFVKLALPISILVGLILAAVIVAIALKGESWWSKLPWRRYGANAAGALALVLVTVGGWAGLKTAREVARENIEWKESAETTTNPVPDAPEVYQYGPSLAAIHERTYTRTMTLPPYMLEHIGTEGIGILAPYLRDPSAETVLKLVDTFRRSGNDLVLTRDVTMLEEDPLSFTNSTVDVKLDRLTGRAYDCAYQAKYEFKNPTTEPAKIRFEFPLPIAGTLRNLSIKVGTEEVPQSQRGTYLWEGEIPPGETRLATVGYEVTGAKTFHYDLGSTRRRVDKFALNVDSDSAVRFQRGSIQPSSTNGNHLKWELSNVITAQQIALAITPDIVGRDTFLQALAIMPASLVLFLLAALALGTASRVGFTAGGLALAAVVFALGLGSASVLASYIGPFAAVFVGPVLGAIGASAIVSPRIWAGAVAAALLPAAFLSPEHTGLIVFVLAVLAVFAGIVTFRRP